MIKSPEAIKTSPSESLCNVLDNFFIRALNNQLVYREEPEGEYIVDEDYEGLPAELICIETDTRSKHRKDFFIYRIKPDDEPLAIPYEETEGPRIFVPKFAIIRVSDNGNTNKDFGISPSGYEEIVEDCDEELMIAKDRTVSITQLARELINGDPTTV